MTYKKLLLPVFAVTMLATSHSRVDAMNFDNKKGLFGAFLGGIAVCWVGQWIWKNAWLKRRRRVHYENLTLPVPTSTKITTPKKPTFDEVNAMVKQLGVNAFIGFYIDHYAPDSGQAWKDCFKHSEIAFDATNGLVNYSEKNSSKRYGSPFLDSTSRNLYHIKVFGDDNSEIFFNPILNEAGLHYSKSANLIQKLRTNQQGEL
jgi:hypothetical protein